MLVFSLRRAGLVEFVVVQVAPDCRRVGRFRVMGHAGVNRVRFRGRFGRRVLGTGTYRITARTLPRGRALANAKLIVVTRPARGDIASARGANACGSTAHGQAEGSAPSSTGGATSTAQPVGHGNQTAAKPPRAHAALGARFTKQAINAVKSIPPWLFALLGLAIVLLAIAALPLRAAPTRGSALALAHNRGVVALAGAALLVTVTVAYTMH